MNIKVYENRLIEFSEKEQGTHNENVVQTLNIEIPSIYDDFYKKIVFVTENGTFWDYIQEDGSYVIPKSVTQNTDVQFYIWLTKTENEVTQDFRTKTYPLFFNENISPDGEVPEEQETEMERVIRILEEEISKVEGLESDVQGLKDTLEPLIEQANNVDIDASKVDKTATVTVTRKTGQVKTVEILDGVSLQFMWNGTQLGIKTENDTDYTFVDLEGQQGPRGEQGEAFQIKKTYATVQAMIADYDNMEINDYVMISGNIEQEDNAKMFVKTEVEDPTYRWQYLADFSGASGIRGPVGPSVTSANINSNGELVLTVE